MNSVNETVIQYVCKVENRPNNSHTLTCEVAAGTGYPRLVQVLDKSQTLQTRDYDLCSQNHNLILYNWPRVSEMLNCRKTCAHDIVVLLQNKSWTLLYSLCSRCVLAAGY